MMTIDGEPVGAEAKRALEDVQRYLEHFGEPPVVDDPIVMIFRAEIIVTHASVLTADMRAVDPADPLLAEIERVAAVVRGRPAVVVLVKLRDGRYSTARFIWRRVNSRGGAG